MALDWDQEFITMFGKTHPIPRLSSWHGDPCCRYTYSNITMDPKPWTEGLRSVGDEIASATGIEANSVLANLYRSGRDRTAWHADDEPELGPEPVIASASFGATRRFRLRRRDASVPPVAIDLEHGSLLVMKGETQTHWEHEITRTAKQVEPRVNLTFRTIKTPLTADPGRASVRRASVRCASYGAIEN